jgi:hypothetical protein
MLGQFAKARNADPTADRQDFLETLRDASAVLMALACYRDRPGRVAGPSFRRSPKNLPCRFKRLNVL